MTGWLLGKNEVLTEDGQCLTDGKLIKAIRASNIAEAYQFKSAIVRRNATTDFAGRMGSGAQDMEFRGNFSSYLRGIGRQLRNDFNANCTRWGNANTYDRTRRTPQEGRYNDRDKETARWDHIRDIIGIIKAGQIALLTKQ